MEKNLQINYRNEYVSMGGENMADQKIENLLNLALNATRREREKSLELDVGYSRDDKEWELIVKYSGTLNELREIGIQVVELSNELQF